MLAENSRAVQSAVLDGEKSVFQKLSAVNEPTSSIDKIVIGYLATLSNLGDHVESIRTKAADAMLSLAAYARRGGGLQAALGSVISSAREGERSYSVLQVLQQADGRLKETGD